MDIRSLCVSVETFASLMLDKSNPTPRLRAQRARRTAFGLSDLLGIQDRQGPVGPFADAACDRTILSDFYLYVRLAQAVNRTVASIGFCVGEPFLEQEDAPRAGRMRPRAGRVSARLSAA